MATKDKYQKYTTNGTKAVVTESCNITTLLVGTDDTNDITITIYDSATDESGSGWSGISSPIGSSTYKADYQGNQGFTGSKLPMENGCYMVISGIGSGWVTVGYNRDMCF